MERRVIEVTGIVQGVGFRPFVHALASELSLQGSVSNRSGSLLIDVEGETRPLERFLNELVSRPPPLARIEQVHWERAKPNGAHRFRIAASQRDRPDEICVAPDAATCDDCLTELFDPADRRFHYPFLNCTNCGPRLTIITGAPYDRPRTTMAAFAMCSRCRAEYENPGDRRFHAQPIACAECGPQLRMLDALGEEIAAGNPLAGFVDALRAGQIGALKGLGGYHLACGARSNPAVVELRRRKHRDEKPLAVMVRDFASARDLCEIDTAEEKLLQSPRAPIVLLRKRNPCAVAESVAPGNPLLGLMLPYTPLHHLLLRAMDGVPLVMTSGNRSDEPIAYEDEDALERLRGIADVFLMHNRPIHVRCDDSVMRVVDAAELPVRRSRGYAPQPVKLPLACRQPTLAVGGQLKATFALGRDRQAFLSHHLGDLDHFEAFRAFERDVKLYEELFGVRPERIAHDLHPDYASTRYAIRQAAGDGAQLVAVQHHHAHMASCMAEHGLTGPVIGVTFDGTGYGTDGGVWGGEFLVGDYREFRRAAHLRYVGMPGGEQAIREPWRMAAAHLIDAGGDPSCLESRIAPAALRIVETMLDRRLNTPMTSSAGRLFDAVAALSGVRDRVTYEGQAAIELEWLATGLTPDGIYPFQIAEAADTSHPTVTAPTLVVDTRPLIRAVADDVRDGIDRRAIARRFHSTVVEMIATVCKRIRSSSGLETVVLSGGVFMNALLTSEVTTRLTDEGFRVYRHQQVPPNDGGLSLGQLAVAAAREATAVSRNGQTASPS